MKLFFRSFLVPVAAAGLVASSAPALAGSHTWDVWEVFSNADGTIQFIELHETNGTNFEIGLGGHLMISHPSGNSFTITHSVASPTAGKFFLLATAGFQALPGAPTPDDIIPAHFIAIPSDSSVEYNPWDTGTFGAGTIPTDGIHSLSRQVVNGAFVVSTNSPTNYAGNSLSIDASPPPPGVPDGQTGTAMKASRLTADGSSISVQWDATTCGDAGDHQILYGDRSGFPGVPGGTYTLLGGTCGIGSTTPYAWTTTPSSGDGSGLVWFLVVGKKASGAEGPWGTYNGTTERNGPGPAGSSNVCATTTKTLTATCGH